jgi:hypothetical protein
LKPTWNVLCSTRSVMARASILTQSVCFRPFETIAVRSGSDRPRPIPALQDRANERARSARKRSLAEERRYRSLMGGLSSRNKSTISKSVLASVRVVSETARGPRLSGPFGPAGLLEVSGLPGGAVPAKFFTGSFRRRFGSLAPRCYAAGMTDSPPPPFEYQVLADEKRELAGQDLLATARD